MDEISARWPGNAAAALMIGVAGFQVALAAGAPWGTLAYGGAATGTLPDHLRVTSALVAPVYLGLAAVASGAVGSRRLRTVVTRAGAGLMAIGAAVNLASPSLPERLVWVPVTAAAALALWHAAPPSVTAPRSTRVAGSAG